MVGGAIYQQAENGEIKVWNRLFVLRLYFAIIGILS